MIKFQLFTDYKEELRRLKICEGSTTQKACEHYRKEFTFLKIFKLNKAQCADCKCPISNKIAVLNPHCKKHDL